VITPSHCAGHDRRGLSCFREPVFTVGLPTRPEPESWRGACAFHLAQVVRTQVAQLASGAVAVAPLNP
jgi:hypothetical protein